MNDVPEVLYDDLWISPEMIIFTGLQQPSESHVLVFKRSPALSPGVSSGWGQTVIITPGLAPDWGDADLTALYTSVMGVAPEAGKKYFCEFYWLGKCITEPLYPRIDAIAKELYLCHPDGIIINGVGMVIKY